MTVTRGVPADQNGIVNVVLPRSTATAEGFKFSLPPDLVLAIAASGAAPSASGSNGEALPAWLRFDPESRSFVASAVPEGALPYQLRVTVGGQSTVIVVAAGSD
ncbi:MAG: hypothetical protein IV107_03125 [Paucibacter sp.]|nr:hypothetical protein [Roseateles sp.]